jgi:predicted enzyme related to lactoylglutathione lyase
VFVWGLGASHICTLIDHVVLNLEEKMLLFNFNRLWRCNLLNCIGMLLIGIVLLTGCSGLNSFSSSPEAQSLTPITDSPTNIYHSGKFVWVDLLTPDAVAAKTFYGALFGWSFEQNDNYTIIKNNGRRIAGIVEVKPKPGKKATALWLTAMSVDNVDKAVSFVKEAGGTVLKGPVNMKNRGRGALVSDPQGAQLILLHAIGGDPSDTTHEIGDWIWNEIWSNVPHETSRFYKELGKYNSLLVGNDYEILSNKNKWRGGIRYIFKKPYQVRWVPAIRVADPVKILEKVEQLGGAVLVHPDSPPSNGDVALISDTNGALLMLQRWAPEQTKEAQ